MAQLRLQKEGMKQVQETQAWIKQGFDPVTWKWAWGTTHLPVGSLSVHLMGSRATQKWIHHDAAAV